MIEDYGPARVLVGIIAGTHGLLRPEALPALSGVSLIVHAGDVGRPEVLAALAALAPVAAIRGNVDRGVWAPANPATRGVAAGAARLYVLHDLKTLDSDPAAAGMAAVISGHSHRPPVERREGVLFVNPGSAGPRRFKLPVSLALLRISGEAVAAELVTLAVA